MDLNHSLMNLNSEDSIPPHSVIESIHPLSVHENLGEYSRRAQEIPNFIPDWLAQLVTKSNNPHKTLKQF